MPFFSTLSGEEILDLAAILIENEVDAPTREPMPVAERSLSSERLAVADDTEVITELGIWGSGLESFLVPGHYSFAVNPRH